MLLCRVCHDEEAAMSLTADAEEEEDHLIPSDNPTETRNKGGRPKGSTIEHSQAQELARKQAVNYVVVKYAALQEEREKEGKKDWSLASGKSWLRQQLKCFALKANLTYRSKQFSAVLIRIGTRSGTRAQSLHC